MESIFILELGKVEAVLLFLIRISQNFSEEVASWGNPNEKPMIAIDSSLSLDEMDSPFWWKSMFSAP